MIRIQNNLAIPKDIMVQLEMILPQCNIQEVMLTKTTYNPTENQLQIPE